MMIKTGVYKHSKSGREYEVIGVGKHSEKLEEMVIYKPMYTSDVAYWVRPASIWNEEVEINGKKVKRFIYEDK